MGIERPKVNSAGTRPITAPVVPPTKAPVAAPAVPRVAALAPAVAAETCTRLSAASSLMPSPTAWALALV